MIPRMVPMINGIGVNSRKRTLAGMYGRKLARNGFAGLALTFSVDISSNLQRVWQNGESAGKTRLLYTRALSEGKQVAEGISDRRAARPAPLTWFGDLHQKTLLFTPAP